METKKEKIRSKIELGNSKMSVVGEQGGKYELLLNGCELESKKNCLYSKGGSECCVINNKGMSIM